MRSFLIATAAVLAAPAGAQTAAAPPPAAWARCAICHSVQPGKTGIGPNLGGVVGRKAGTLPGFTYSPAMKAAGWVWTKEKIATFIANPQGVVKGTKMYFTGLTDEKDRAAVVAFLAAHRSSAQ